MKTKNYKRQLALKIK